MTRNSSGFEPSLAIVGGVVPEVPRGLARLEAVQAAHEEDYGRLGIPTAEDEQRRLDLIAKLENLGSLTHELRVRYDFAGTLADRIEAQLDV